MQGDFCCFCWKMVRIEIFYGVYFYSFILNSDLNMEKLLKVSFEHIAYASYAYRKKEEIKNENVKE
jgi:hypothetical protein